MNACGIDAATPAHCAAGKIQTVTICRDLAPVPVEVETLDGRMASTDQLAREALDQYERTLVTAAR